MRTLISTLVLLTLACADRPTSSVSLLDLRDGLVVEPQQVALAALGESRALAARGVDRNGERGDPVDATWTTLTPGTVRVDLVAGVPTVTALANGEGTIQARLGGLTAAVRVAVRQVAVSVAASTALSMVESLGAGPRLSGLSYDARGVRILSRAVSWTSLDPSIVTVAEDGRVMAHANGETMIVASAEGLADTVRVIVRQVARRLSFTSEPRDVEVAGEPIGPTIRVEVQDANGWRIPGARFEVHVALTQVDWYDESHELPLQGTKMRTTDDGIVTFDDLYAARALGSQHLYAWSPQSGESGPLWAADGRFFRVAPSAPFALAFGHVSELLEDPMPTRFFAEESLGTLAYLRDRFGNVADADGVTVSISVESGPGAMRGATAGVSRDGVVDLTSAYLDVPGTYALLLRAAGLQDARFAPVIVIRR